jgi:hypothetical protein
MAKGKTVEVKFTFEDGSIWCLTGDDAHRWTKSLSDILIWLRPVTRFKSGDFPWSEQGPDGIVRKVEEKEKSKE